MSCNNCNTSPCCCYRPPPACNCPPSPIPPWSRPTQSPLNQTLVDTAIPLVLDPDVTYLRNAGSVDPLALVLPNGNFLKQTKQIMIPTDQIATTSTWIVSGTFAGGFTHCQFDAVGTYALLQWDGFGWQFMGGNATLQA